VATWNLVYQSCRFIQRFLSLSDIHSKQLHTSKVIFIDEYIFYNSWQCVFTIIILEELYYICTYRQMNIWEQKISCMQHHNTYTIIFVFVNEELNPSFAVRLACLFVWLVLQRATGGLACTGTLVPVPVQVLYGSTRSPPCLLLVVLYRI
jgi:hypothetical protein